MPTFRVGGKVFAHYAVNHHGDGRVALWLNAPPGAQAQFVEVDAEVYFVPPYTGAKGWLGVNVDKNLNWDEVQYQVAEAYLHTSRRTDLVEEVLSISEPPNAPVDPVEFDAFNDPENAELLEVIRAMCMELPEVTEGRQFGSPAFKAGKKTFATVHVLEVGVSMEVWVGLDQQSALLPDPRFVIPRYIGHNGWIRFALIGEDAQSVARTLILASYKHFALKRMLSALDAIARDG